MYLSGSACERAIVLPGGGPPAFIASATSPTEAPLETLLGFYTDQALDFGAWRQASTRLNDPLIRQIAEDITFSEEIGIGLWFFGRMPFLERLRVTSSSVETEEQFKAAALQTLLFNRLLPISVTLPGQLDAMAAQLSIREPSLSSTQWRMWIDFALSFSFPLTEPAAALWGEILGYQVPVPGSPALMQITLKDLIEKAPKLVLLPISAGGVAAAYQIVHGDYMAAWVAALTGAGTSILLVATRSLLAPLLTKVEPVQVPGRSNTHRGRSTTR